MNIVIDTNILFSALIRDSITREIIVESGWNIYYPEISFHEIRKYKTYILGKSGMDEDEYKKLLNDLLNQITIIPEESIRCKLEEARKVIGEVDPDDVVFIAAALGLEDSVIWSDDKDFDKQDKVKVLKTVDMVGLM